MSQFEITVLPPSEITHDGARLGRIVIGDFSERFPCYPTGEPAESMSSSWNTELNALLNGAEAVALIHDPRFAWIIYREGENCFVHQLFSAEGKFDQLPPRQTTNENGDRISEWPIPLSSIRSFIENGS